MHRSTHMTSLCTTTKQRHINTDQRTPFRRLMMNWKTFQTNWKLSTELNKRINAKYLFHYQDHKENFENNLKCRQINTAKIESGKLSKVILDQINSNLRPVLNVAFYMWGGGGQIFTYSYSQTVKTIAFKGNKWCRTWIYEYLPPPKLSTYEYLPPPKTIDNQLKCLIIHCFECIRRM